MKKIVIILSIGLNLLSCRFGPRATSKGESIKEIMETQLIRDNYVIPDSLFSFFPNDSELYDDLNVMMIRTTNIGKSENHSYIAMNFSISSLLEIFQSDNNELLEPLTSKYKRQALFSTRSEKSNYFILDSERELLKMYDTLILKNEYLEHCKDPLIFRLSKRDELPSFLFDSTTVCGLPSGYEILVLKSGNEIVLPESHIYKWPLLPECIKHGYRSGVAFKENEPYIIYWVIAW